MTPNDGHARAAAPMGPPSAWIIASLMLTTFATSLNGMAFGPFLPVMATDLGTSVALLGQVPALMMLLSALLGLVIGPLADQLGHRRTLVTSLLVLAVGTLGLGLAPTYVLLLLMALVGAAGRAAAYPVALVIAGTRFAGDQQRRVVSWTMTGISGAVIAGIPLLTTIAAILDWRAALLGLALLTAVIAAIAQRSLGADSPRAATVTRLGDILAAYRPLVAHRPTLGLIGASVLNSAGMGTVLTYLGAFYVQQHAYTIQQVGLVYLLAGGSIVVGTLAAGGRLGALPLRPLVIAMRLVNALAFGAAMILPIPALATIGLFVLQAGTHGVAVVAVTLLLTRDSPAGRATTMTLNGGSISLGTALGSALGGLMLALAGYPASGLCALLLCGASASLVWWSGRHPAVAPTPTTPPAVG